MIFDLTNRESFEDTKNWHRDIVMLAGSDCNIALIGNKVIQKRNNLAWLNWRKSISKRSRNSWSRRIRKRNRCNVFRNFSNNERKCFWSFPLPTRINRRETFSQRQWIPWLKWRNIAISKSAAKKRRKRQELLQISINFSQ